MDNKNSEDFISKLKDNLVNINQCQYNNNTKYNNTNIDLEELIKKIGKMETSLKYYEGKIDNELNERKLMEQRYESRIFSLTNDINDIKDNLNNFSNIFAENFEKIKNNIIENVEIKNNSLNKIILESSKKINALEDLLMNNKLDNDGLIMTKSINNTLICSSDRDNILRKMNQIESMLFNKDKYPEREEVNLSIVKINHLDKQFRIFLEKYEKDFNDMKNNLKKYINNMQNLICSQDILSKKYENLYKNFNETNLNINKFNYQTTILLQETQKKMDNYTNFYQNTKVEINQFKKELSDDNLIIKDILSNKINEFDGSLSEFKNRINSENVEFTKNIEEKCEKFIDFIQTENNKFLFENKAIQKNIIDISNKLENDNIEINKNINEIKNTFFHNLNEIEQYFNKRYDIINKALKVNV